MDTFRKIKRILNVLHTAHINKDKVQTCEILKKINIMLHLKRACRLYDGFLFSLKNK